MSESDSGRDPVEMLAESFVERLRRGETPSVSEYVARSPEHAEEIRDLFPALVEMESAKQSHPSLEARPTTRADTPERLGDYRVLRLLGAGGMGVVYEAERESLRSHVALKVLHPRFRIDPTYLARFRNEARSAAQLHHTNIVTVFDYGEQDGVFYYAMQYIPGQGLDKVLDDARRLRQSRSSNGKSSRPIENKEGDPAVGAITEALLSGRFADETPALAEPEPAMAEEKHPSDPTASSALGADSSGSFGELSDRGRYYREVARIGLQLADALAYAHARGVIHRDIKPANLILDGRGNVWVTDFGLAKFADQDLSNSQDIVGTLRYMSPERFKGVTSPAVDIYALGATLYELLTLRPVFESADKLRLIDAITHRDPVRPREIERQLPLDLETLVLKALAKDPQQRFANALELREELRRFLENRPIRSRPAPIHERYWRWCKRNPLLAASNLTAALLATVITIGSVLVASMFYAKNNELILRQETINREAKRRVEAERTVAADREARQKASIAMLLSQESEAMASRFSRRVGQRFDTLKAVGKAVAQLSSLELAKDEALARRNKLRDLAIAALALPDVHRVAEIPWPEGSRMFEVDLIHGLYVRSDKQGNVFALRLQDDTEVARLSGDRGPLQGIGMVSDKEVNLCWSRDADVFPYRKWNPSTGRLSDWMSYPDYEYSQDDLHLRLEVGWRSKDPKTLTIFEQYDGRSVRTLPPMPSPNRRGCIEVSPDGKTLACAYGEDDSDDSNEVHLFDVESGKKLADLPHDDTIRSLVWLADGRTLATGCADTNEIRIWDVIARPPRVVHRLTRQKGGDSILSTNRTGNLLATTSLEAGGLRLWDPRTGQELLHFADTKLLLGRKLPDGRLWGWNDGEASKTIWEAVPAREYVTLTHSPEFKPPDFRSLSISPDGRLIAAGVEGGVALWDVAGEQERAFLPLGDKAIPWFEPHSGDLFTGNRYGLFRWPLSSIGADQLRLGPPEPWINSGHFDGPMSGSLDGRLIAVAGLPNSANVIAFENGPPRRTLRFGPDREARQLAVSPEGRYVATAGSDRGVKVWECSSGKLIHEMPDAPSPHIQFSRNGHWLLISVREGDGDGDRPADRTQLWEVGTWRPLWPERVDGGSPGVISPDDQLVVTSKADGRLCLVSIASGHTLASLEGPNQGRIGSLSFSPDGGKIFAASSESGAVQAWDLRAIRRQLIELNLDWEGPPLPPPPPQSLAAVGRIEIVGAEEVSIFRFRAHRARERALARLSLNPSDGEAHYKLGEALMMLGRPAEAFAHLTTAQRLLPDPTDAIEQRARAGVRLGRWSDVLVDTAEGLKHEPDNARFREFRGRALQKLGRHEEAIGDLTAALARFSRDGELYQWRAESLSALGRRDEAEADDRKAEELSTPLLLNKLARNLTNGLEGECDPASALLLIRRALKNAPNDVSLFNALGVALYRNALYGEAIPILERSLATSKGESDAFDLFFLAMARHRLGEIVAARADFDRALTWLENHPSLEPRYVTELTNFRDEAEALLATPPVELPADVFAR